ncbi:nuclear transport factor 2 family protein [Draconibacterium sp.]|nr:nuclear transport factor 2 family protein [Draconibacterium sp.]
MKTLRFQSDADKKQVKKEILEVMNEFAPALREPMDPEKMFNLFLQTDELAVATEGVLLKNPSVLLDTMKLHMSAMQKQVTKNVDDKIYVISKDAAVISSSKIVTVTLKSGGEVTMPYALTMLLVKREGGWKIAHYHI